MVCLPACLACLLVCLLACLLPFRMVKLGVVKIVGKWSCCFFMNRCLVVWCWTVSQFKFPRVSPLKLARKRGVQEVGKGYFSSRMKVMEILNCFPLGLCITPTVFQCLWDWIQSSLEAIEKTPKGSRIWISLVEKNKYDMPLSACLWGLDDNLVRAKSFGTDTFECALKNYNFNGSKGNVSSC